VFKVIFFKKSAVRYCDLDMSRFKRVARHLLLVEALYICFVGHSANCLTFLLQLAEAYE